MSVQVYAVILLLDDWHRPKNVQIFIWNYSKKALFYAEDHKTAIWDNDLCLVAVLLSSHVRWVCNKRSDKAK